MMFGSDIYRQACLFSESRSLVRKRKRGSQYLCLLRRLAWWWITWRKDVTTNSGEKMGIVIAQLFIKMRILFIFFLFSLSCLLFSFFFTTLLLARSESRQKINLDAATGRCQKRLWQETRFAHPARRKIWKSRTWTRTHLRWPGRSRIVNLEFLHLVISSYCLHVIYLSILMIVDIMPRIHRGLLRMWTWKRNGNDEESRRAIACVNWKLAEFRHHIGNYMHHT